MTILDDHARPSRRTMAFVPLTGIAVVTATLAAAQPSAPQRGATVTTTSAAPSQELPAIATASQVLAERVVSAAETGQTQHRYSMANDCGWEWNRDGYTGMTSYTLRSGVAFNQFRHDGHDRTIVNQTADVKACMFAEGVGGDRDMPPRDWMSNSRVVRLSARRGGVVQRMDIVRDGGDRITWTVGGAERPVDDAARLWRDRIVAYLDAAWELGHLRGRVSSLQGDISSIYGDRSSLQGDISSLQGEVSSMRGDISSVRGDESSMRGEISSIQGELSSLEGEISSELGAISSIQGGGLRITREENDRQLARIEEHRRNIARLQRQIREFDAPRRVAAVEQRIADFNADRRVAELEARIKAFDLNGRVAEIERRIAALDVDRRVKAIENEIRGLDAERRGREMETRIEQARQRLEAAMGAVK